MGIGAEVEFVPAWELELVWSFLCN